MPPLKRLGKELFCILLVTLSFQNSYRLAMMELGKITGRVDVEELLDIIFRDFCIGK